MSALIRRRFHPNLRLEQLETRDTPVVFSNPASISIPDNGAATPYPSTINVTGMGDQVVGVTVTLTNITHTYPNDIDVLLVGPQGQTCIIMSDVGGTTAVTNVTVTFSQSAAGSLTTSALPPGIYQPTNSGTGDTFPSPAPQVTYGTTLTPFVGTNPNGTWGLYVVDDAGGDLGSIGGGWSIDVNAPPRVTGIALASPNPTSAATVDFTVTFNVPVVGVDAADFTAAMGGGLTGAFVSGVSGTGNTRTVTVNTGVGDGKVGLNVTDNDSILGANSPLTTSPLGGTGVGNGNFVGPEYTVDKPPAVVSVVRVSPNPTNAPSVAYTVTFTEAVTGVDTTDFALTTTGTMTGSSVSNVSGSGTTYTVTVTVGTGTGTLRLDVADDDTIISGGIPLAGVGAGNGNFTTGELYTIDRTPPMVSSVVRASVNPTNAGAVTYTVTFDEAVTGVDVADFTLTTTGISGASVTGVSGTGTTRSVTVTTGTGSGTLRLDLADDDSIADAAGNKLGGTGAGNGDFATGQVFTIDKTGPASVSLVRASANPTNAASVTYTVTFNEAVTGVDAADFTLTTTGVSGASITNVSGSGNTRTVTVATGTGSGTIRLDLKASGTGIADTLGNPSTIGLTTGEVYTIDKTGPAVVSLVRASANPTNAASVVFTVDFGEPVTGVDAADFTLTTTGVSGASITNVSGTGNTRTVTVATGTGSGTIRLDLKASGTGIADALGNLSTFGFTTGEVFTVDKSGPAVASLVRASANPTNAASVDFTVTFDESATGVDAADFTLTTTGVSGASITNVSGSGSTYTVTVATGTDSGTIRLDLNAAGTGIADALGNLSTTGFTTGEVYTIDKTPPVVADIVRALPNPISAASVAFTVTFTKAVTGLDTSDFQAVMGGGLSGASVTNVSGSGAAYTVTVATGSGTGTLGLNLLDDDTVLDTLGNPLGDAGLGNGDFTGPVYDVDLVAPSVVGVVRAAADPTEAATVEFTVTFTEFVANWFTTDFTPVVTGSLAGATVKSVVRVSDSVLAVTVATVTGAGTLGLDVSGLTIVDSLGNPLAAPFSGGETYTIARIAPTVTSVTRASASPSSAASVDFTVTFSEAVTGVNAPDFALTTSGLTGASVTGVSGSGSTYTVTVNTGTGSGTLRLDVKGTGTGIRDATNNALAAGFTGGQVYAIQKTATPVTPPVVVPKPTPLPVHPAVPLPLVVGVAGGSAGATAVTVSDPTTGQPTRTFTPFAGFRGAVSVTQGDVNGDGTADIVAGAGVGGAPHVMVFDGKTGATLASFFAFGSGFTGGVSVAAGDVNADGHADVIVGAGAGGGPHVKVFDGVTFAEVASFFAYDASFLGGVNVAAGDVNADGHADIVTGTRAGGTPHVKAFSGLDQSLLRSFFAYPASFVGGVSVAVGDVNGDGFADIITGAGAGGAPHVKAFSGLDGSELASFLAFGSGFTGGVSVGTSDENGDGIVDLVVGAGPGGGPHVKMFAGVTFAPLYSGFVGNPNLTGGVNVG